MTSPLYLRDLKDSLREEFETGIRKERPDLLEALDNGDDIRIGEVFRITDCEIEK